MSGDWIWDGGRPAVDLLNTLRNRKAGGRETLRDSADLANWLVTAGLAETPDGTTDGATERELTAARSLRTAIDTAAFAVIERRPVPVDAVTAINAVISAASLAPSLGLDDQGRPFVIRDSSVAMGLTRVAADAIDLLTDGELARLRVCAADDCGVRFVDRSPSGNRQWCSMRRCGNRTKARRHYARRHG
jgi:predicted RNA-binding Zn ribbon-like protein